jgi:protein SCO1/2
VSLARVLVFLAAACAVAGAAPAQPVTGATQRSSPAGKPPDALPSILSGVGIAQKLGSALPLEARFRDEAGREVALSTYFGKRPVVMALVYYECPMLCSQVLQGLLSTLSVLNFDAGKDFEVVVVSFDPRETPAMAANTRQGALARYGRPGTDAGWHFLTGDEASITRLAEAIGFRYAWDEKAAQFAHASAIYVATADGRLARYFFGIEYAPRDVRLGLVEASAGRLGTPVDSVLLYCFHYDPAAGRYGAVALNMVRLGGAITVVILAAYLFAMWRRDRRARRAETASGAV